jgi:hypothetical protein
MMENENKQNKENNFYSFRKIIKEDLYETTLEELSKKITILDEISEESLQWSEEFQNLITLAEDIIKNRCDKEPDYLYGYGEEVVFDDKLIMKAKRITIARLACFLVDHQNYLLERPFRFQGIVMSYIRTLRKIGSKKLRNKYCITQFIHSSRGLLDTENPETGTDLMKQLMDKADVNHYKLNDEQRTIFNQVDAFWKNNVIGSYSFDKAIERFLECYDINLPVGKVRDLLKVMEIDFVDAKAYYGMVGFNGILLSVLAFEHLYKDKKLTMRFILTTIIHECAHYILRIIRDDFGFLTPTNGHDDEKRKRLEAGYLFEDILFGDVWKEASDYKFLMEPEIWGKDIPIIPEGDLVSLGLKGEKDNLCTSGFLMAETKKWM